MACKKDEAVRASEIAEVLFLERDFTGAKKLALKAHTLFSELDGLSQFLEMINVYVAHEKKKNGEVDYYGILGVDPFSDEEALRRQYRRKALALHPDKNKSVGADGAFVILSQAWSVLSDKDKRSAYDMKLNIRASNQSSSQPCLTASYHPRNTTSGTHFQHRQSRQWTPAAATVVGSRYTPAPYHPGSSTLGTSTQHTAAAESQYDPSPPPLHPTPGTSTMNVPAYQRTPPMSVQCETIPVPPHQRNPTPRTGNQDSSSRNPRLVPRHRKIPPPTCAAQRIPSRNLPTSSTCLLRPETFWTLCNRCRIQYEHQKVFLNQNLLCPCCQNPFLAREMPAPNADSRSSCPSPIHDQQQDTAAATSGFRSMQPSVTRTSQPSREHAKRRHEIAVNMGRDNDEMMKNSSIVPENVETAPPCYTVSGGLNREKPVKKRRKDDQKCDNAKERSQGTAGYSGVKRASANVKGYFEEEQQSRSVKELSQREMHVMLMGKAKAEILHRLNEWESKKADSSHLKRVETRDSLDALMVDSINHPGTYKSRDGLSSDPNTSQPRNSSTLEETDLGAPDEFVSMVVPDANFHNFDEDRVEDSFAQGQVWAAYDDDDGMPRHYALVHNVISRSPFKIQMSWLNSKSSSEFGSLDWIASGFTKTTGDFRIGKFVVSKRLNSFSHPVKWKKGARGVIQILPTKGDVWALYSNWSPDWNETTADEIIHEYDLVVILLDYIEDIGVLVAPLVKVAGFTSVFNQLLDEREIRTIPREEMFRFSHQVPFYKLDGLEAENAPKDCHELDPAALPLKLLKEITDAESAERRVFGQPVPESEATAEPGTEDEKRCRDEDVKYLLKYSRKNKGRELEGNFFQSLQSASSDTF